MLPTTQTWTLTYRTWDRTRRHMRTVRTRLQGTSRFGVLRAWWRVQRQYQPLVEVMALERHLDYRAIQREDDWARLCAE